MSYPMSSLISRTRGRLKRVGLFFLLCQSSAAAAACLFEDSVRFAHSGPSHNLLRPAGAELVSCGPLPLPVSGGGHASQRQLPSATLRPGAPMAMYFLRLCASATSPNSTLTLALDFSLKRLKPWLNLMSPKTASGSMGRMLL